MPEDPGTPAGPTIATRADPGDATADGRPEGTLAPSNVSTADPSNSIIPSWGTTTYASLPAPGYQIGALIGRGGMGEVVVAQDQRIGREVAVKRIRAQHPTHDAVERFLREARIQARLDHPAIVPVYELGTDEAGLPYFTMKRLTGVTLAKRLAKSGGRPTRSAAEGGAEVDHKSGGAEVDAKAPIQPLLRAFVDVCLAIQLAHTRGVVHRDLKPSNIMLGDFGEVYVLDWGVARVLADRSRSTHPMQAIDDHDAIEDGTTAGSILGTPGYMPPEQVKGDEVGPPADVYALGAILFEILAGEPLHPRGEAALGTTLTQPQEAPANRAADRTIPPELDGVCFDALAEDPAARPTARELAVRIQSYLDGDRDVERRRGLAAEQLESARDALAAGGIDAHAAAMRRAGRALALDPENEDAAGLVGKLLLEPPKDLPPDLIERMTNDATSLNRERSRKALISYASIIVLAVALIPWMQVNNWTLQLGFLALVALLCILAYEGSRTGRMRLVPAFVINLLGIVLFSQILGPFILTPILTIGVLLAFSASPRLLARPLIIWSWCALAIGLPIVLEITGALPRTTSFHDGAFITTSGFYRLGNLSEPLLIIADLAFMAITVAFMIAISRGRDDARKALQVQAWHLEQMLPRKRTRQPKSRR
ncbi:MAG: protein kinase [Kofleriaceae bacterium]